MKKYLLSFLILLLLTGCNVQNSHSHIKCQECGKCIAVECDGLEEEKCQGHQPVHTHTECQECGKCIAEDCNGLEEEKCQECITFELNEEIYVSFLFEENHEEMAQCIVVNTYEEYMNFIITNSIMNIEFGEIDGFVYNDKYISALDKYDENYFKHSSLMFFCVGSIHSRVNPRLIYEIEYEEDILIVNMTITFDGYPIDFQGALFYSVEVNKNLINNYKGIEYKANKIVIYD